MQLQFSFNTKSYRVVNKYLFSILSQGAVGREERLCFFPCELRFFFYQKCENFAWCLVAQLCPTLCNPWTVARQAPLSMGLLQARILEWVAMTSFRGSSQPRDQTQVSCIAGGYFYHLSHQGSPRILDWVVYPFSRGSSQPRN